MSREYVLQPFRSPVNLQIDYANELNPQQHAAATALPGPCLVLAGAGSGKTRTLIYRVAYLLEQGIPADRILLLTFTNKAAREMMRRVAELLGGDLSDLWGGTFHSIGNRVLRRHADRVGYSRDFTIMDRDDAKELLDAAVGEMDIDVKATRFPKADVLADIFSLAINKQQTIREVIDQEYDYFTELASQIEEVERRYSDRKRAAGMMDFDDLLVLWLRLLQEHPDVRELYQRRFQFVLVDEYQDTNKLQADLIDLLAARHHNVMAVGDDSQSIYSWRGANFRNILDFPKRHPDAKIYKIETNYRSTPEILSLANAAIAANVHQFQKELVAARKPGAKPVLAPCGDAYQQAAFVAQRALELREEGVSLNEMAVLYRSHYHALELQMELTKRNIPFAITSGIRFFEQAHIKDVAAHLKLVWNPADELSFKRLAKMLPGIGAKGADKLWKAFSENYAVISNQCSVISDQPIESSSQPHAPGSEITDSALRITDSALRITDSVIRNTQHAIRSPVATALQACAKSVPKKAATSWAQFVATISQLEAEPVRSQPAKMIRLVVDAGYDDYLKSHFTNYRTRLEDVQQLADFSRQFTSIQDFLSELALLTDMEADDEAPAEPDAERIRLSTIHQAKGLEFSVVFLIMLCDGLFPSARSVDTDEGEEEERRLFYVATTRAKDELYLSYPLIRVSQGQGAAMQQPSRFLQELPEEVREEWNLRSFNAYS